MHSPGHHDSDTSALKLSAASQRLAAGIKVESSGQMRAPIFMRPTSAIGIMQTDHIPMAAPL